MLSRCFLDFSVGVGAFVIALAESDPLPFSLTDRKFKSQCDSSVVPLVGQNKSIEDKLVSFVC